MAISREQWPKDPLPRCMKVSGQSQVNSSPPLTTLFLVQRAHTPMSKDAPAPSWLLLGQARAPRGPIPSIPSGKSS